MQLKVLFLFGNSKQLYYVLVFLFFFIGGAMPGWEQLSFLGDGIRLDEYVQICQDDGAVCLSAQFRLVQLSSAWLWWRDKKSNRV